MDTDNDITQLDTSDSIGTIGALLGELARHDTHRALQVLLAHLESRQVEAETDTEAYVNDFDRYQSRGIDQTFTEVAHYLRGLLSGLDR